MLQQTDIVGHLVGAGCNTCQNVHHSGIHFSGIGLSGYRNTFFKAHLLCDHRINLINLLLISIEEFQEACLGTGCSFGTKKFHGT